MTDIYKPMSFYTVDKNFVVKKDGHTMMYQDVSRALNDHRRGYLNLLEDNKRLKKAMEKMQSIINGVDL